jgi:signal transduction histidine kinase
MPARRPERTTQRRWRLWTNRLWILSVALGVLSVLAAAGLIHRTYERRQAASLIAVSTLHQVGALAHDQLAAIEARTSTPLSALPADSARRLLGPILRRIIDSTEMLAKLDTMSVRVTRADGQVLFGAIAPEHRIRADMAAHGPLRGLTLAIGVGSWQLPEVLLIPIRHQDMWHLALLIVATGLVSALSFGSARREAALASARGDFIAGISHDLRMPLAQILLASETMSIHDDLAATERRDLSNSIVRESRRMIGLVENLLLFSRSGAVELETRSDSVDVDQLLRDAIEAVQLAAKDAGQSITVVGSSNLTVLGDRRLLHQALMNLLDNALKYGSPGQEITVGADVVSSERVRVRVEDHGPGIPAAEQRRVFEPYERLLRDQSSERTGTGLGLAVVADIVRACRGRVWIEDVAGGGTRVVVELIAAR